MSTLLPSVPYNPYATYPTEAGSKFSNAKLQAAIDDALANLPADKNVAIVAHQVYNQDGTTVENVTSVSLVARVGDSFYVEAAGYKDWTHGDLGGEVKVVKTF